MLWPVFHLILPHGFASVSFTPTENVEGKDNLQIRTPGKVWEGDIFILQQTGMGDVGVRPEVNYIDVALQVVQSHLSLFPVHSVASKECQSTIWLQE